MEYVLTNVKVGDERVRLGRWLESRNPEMVAVNMLFLPPGFETLPSKPACERPTWNSSSL